MQLPLGTRLFNGHYSIGKVLGQGGFGIIYAGSDTGLKRLVAIKEFFPQGCTRQDLAVQPGSLPPDEYERVRAKFRSEAEALAQFQHRNIVGIHACFAENNTAYMVMEFLKGQTLEQLVAQRGALPEREALGIVEQVGAALEVMHQANRIHRDINPTNIIQCEDGRVVVIDFGLNRELEEASAYGTQRLTGTMPLGTPGYAPLEQHGRRGRVGVFTDIYALGATLYFLLTGAEPVEATQRHDVDLPPPHQVKTAVSQAVSAAVMQAMEMKSAARPQRVREFLDVLSRGTIAAIPTQLVSAPSLPQSSVLRPRGHGQPTVVSPPVPPPPIQERVNPKDGALMVYVPAGEFTMGSNDGDTDEKPLHKVYLAGYWIYKTAVTVGQYRKFCNATRHAMPPEPGWGWQENHPVVNVGWDDAQAYCDWAGVSLPTEAQWEKAARGTDGRLFPWGNNFDVTRLRCSIKMWGDAGSPVAVGSYPGGASPYGCLDMAGNVWQWCADWYDAGYYKSAPTRNPTGPSTGDARVVRGGSWFIVTSYFARTSYRSRLAPGNIYKTYGFRCVAVS